MGLQVPFHPYFLVLFFFVTVTTYLETQTNEVDYK